MLIDTTILMYAAFQSCRHGGAGGLDVLHSVLECVRQTGTLELESDTPAVATALALLPIGYEDELAESPVSTALKLSAANQPLFDVVAIAVDDLRALHARGEQLAMRDLGYALHNLPGLLVRPTEFDREAYTFSFKFVAFHWNQLSSELRLALARLMDMEPEQLDALASKQGFAASMYGDSSR